VVQVGIPTELPEGTVYDIETQVAATLEFELSGGQQVTVRYERTCATHGDAFESEGIYGTEGYLKWNWLPFGDDLKITVQNTLGKEEQVTREIPATPYPEGDDWVVAPLREMDRHLRGEETAGVLVNDRALQTFRLLRAIYEAGESGEPVVVEFDLV
jgi:predicted dehydrogenase